MKVLVIPDVHLKPKMFYRAAAIMHQGLADRAVCLMDIADDWGQEYNVDLYVETYDAAISFAKEYPDTVWCYGNHDLSYVWYMPETGYSSMAMSTVQRKLIDLKVTLPENNPIKYVQRIDNVIFSHGGVSDYFVREYVPASKYNDIDTVVDTINCLGVNEMWNDASPIWLRPQYETREIFRADTYKQVVGHTPVEKIFEKDGIISTDVFSTYRDGRQIGESAMIVIDSETGKYEKVEVMGEQGV